MPLHTPPACLSSQAADNETLLLLSEKLATNTAHNRVDLLDCSDCIMALNRNQRSVLSDSPIQACPEEILASIISRVDADSR